MNYTSLNLCSVLCALGLATTRANAGILTGPINNPANGHSYYLLDQNNWTSSEAEAMALGGHLATISDPTENNWVFSTFGSFGGLSRCLWIGLTDQSQEGVFVWSSGEPLAYTHWQSPPQPDNAGGVVAENYVHLLPPGHYAGGYWNDFQNVSSVSFGDVPLYGVPLNGVVEVVPEPSFLLVLLPVLFLLKPLQNKTN